MATCNKRTAALRHLPRAVALLMAGAAALAAAQDRPESLLPPGFGQPAAPASPRPTPRGTPAARPVPGAAATPAVQPTPVRTPTDPVGAMIQPLPTPAAIPTPTPSPSATIDAQTLAEYELPASARRSLAQVGPAGPREGALDERVFAGADGRVAEMLMRRLSAPLPSRWASILLRRTLAARMDTPRGVNGADFAAERAWLLLRMGEAQVARAVVQSVDSGNYTPKLYQVGLNALLASSDPAGLCPLSDRGSAVTGLGGYRVAQAICAALSGEGARGTVIMRQVRRQRIADDFDLKLAEKLMGAGGRRAVTVDWNGADRLTTWRFGLTTATGLTTPPEYLSYVEPQVRGWLATSPAIAATDRASVIDQAAAMGVLSNAALVDFYAGLADDDQASRAQGAIGNNLRNAYAANDEGQRLSAIRSLWGDDDRTPYGRLILTARAVARLPVVSSESDSDRLVASMLSAGLDRSAARWRSSVKANGNAWAMIELSDPDQQGRVGYDQVGAYDGQGDALKQRLFFAGMAGLGRLTEADIERGAQALDVRIGQRNAWTEALDRAVADEQTGMVVLLCAIGMQTGDWRGVPPQALYRIVGALRAVGLDTDARMIAAEAIARA